MGRCSRPLCGGQRLRRSSLVARLPNAAAQSILLNVDDGRTVLLVGDAAYTVRSISEQLLPMLTANDTASGESLQELNEFAKRDSEAILVPSHDPDAWRQLERPASPG